MQTLCLTPCHALNGETCAEREGEQQRIIANHDEVIARDDAAMQDANGNSFQSQTSAAPDGGSQCALHPGR